MRLRGFARRVKEITGARESANPEPPYKAAAHRAAWAEGYLEADEQAARREVVNV